MCYATTITTNGATHTAIGYANEACARCGAVRRRASRIIHHSSSIRLGLSSRGSAKARVARGGIQRVSPCPRRSRASRARRCHREVSHTATGDDDDAATARREARRRRARLEDAATPLAPTPTTSLSRASPTTAWTTVMRTPTHRPRRRRARPVAVGVGRHRASILTRRTRANRRRIDVAARLPSHPTLASSPARCARRERAARWCVPSSPSSSSARPCVVVARRTSRAIGP